MKNIMLLGISRSGKSTFANILAKQYGYNVIHGDMIKVSYQKNILNVSSSELKNKQEYRNFIKDIFRNEIKYNNLNYVIDTVDIFPSDIDEFDRENYLIYFFGYTKHTTEEIVNIWKKTDLNFTKKFTEEELYAKAKRGVENSIKIKEECEKYGLTFIDTSDDRNEIFSKLLSEISI